MDLAKSAEIQKTHYNKVVKPALIAYVTDIYHGLRKMYPDEKGADRFINTARVCMNFAWLVKPPDPVSRVLPEVPDRLSYGSKWKGLPRVSQESILQAAWKKAKLF